MVCILIFVYHYVAKASLVFGKCGRALPQHMQCVYQKVIKVHGIVLFQLCLICTVYIVYHLVFEFSAVKLEIFIGAYVCFFLLAYYRAQICLRKELYIYILLFNYVLYQGFLIHCVIYYKVPLVSDHIVVLSENSEAHCMKSHYPHSGTVADELFHTLSHLARCLVGEGHRQNLIRTHALLYQVCDSVCHRGGLAAAGSRQYQKRTVDMSYRLLLLWV